MLQPGAGNPDTSPVLEDVCCCALPSSKVSPDPFHLSGLLPCCFFLPCCHGNAACIHPWSCLHPSLVQQPVSATSLLPRVTAERGLVGLLAPQLPSLQAPEETLLKDKKREGGGHPGGCSVGLCWSLLAAAGARAALRASVEVCFIRPAPASEQGRAETAIVMRRAEIAAHSGRGAVEKAGGQ